MKALKFVVIAMSVVLLAGFVGLFVMWQKKPSAKVKAPQAVVSLPVSLAQIDADASRAVGAMVAAQVELPVGAKVIQVSSSAAHLDVLVALADGSFTIYQIARASGAVDGTLHLATRP